MEDKIIIVDNTVETIAIEEFRGVPTGTIITTTHGMDNGDQHTIKDIVGLKTKLDNIEKLKPIRSNLSGRADYYQWGEEATESNPIGPGYFVRLGEDGMIYKCTNEITVHTTDVLGVTVSSAGFIGNDENIVDTYTSAKSTDISYALVATSGVVDVLCGYDIAVGDYVFPTVNGWAAKSTGSYGYLVAALVQNGEVVQGVNKEEVLYARIVLSQSVVNAKKVSDNVDYLLTETQRIGENVVKAVSDAQTALNEIRDNGSSLSSRVNDFENSMNNMGEQLYKNTIALDEATTTAVNAETIAKQAEEFVQEVASNATGGASEALAIAKTLEGEMKTLSEDMKSYSSKFDTIEEEQSAQALIISKANNDIAVVQTKATALENSVTSLANKDTELAQTVALIDQKSNEQGASITALTSKIDKYSVGEYSQAYGLTQAQAADILEAGKIVFIPTDFTSNDVSFTEHYNPIVLTSWDAKDKNTKHIYEVGNYYYYHDGQSWVQDTINNAQTRGYCVTNFTEHYSYMWDGKKWTPETTSINVFFKDDMPTGMSSVSPLYWVVGAGYKGTDYKVGALYLYKNNTWSEVALGSSNSMSRVSALVTQTQNSWQTAITNVNNDLAAISAKVDENGSNVAMVASVVKEVEGVNLDVDENNEVNIYASKNDIQSVDTTKYFVVGSKTPYDIYYYNGTKYVQKINWSYDGQRVLQPNTASIVTSANEDGSGILLNASHIKFEGETYTVDAGNIDFTGNNYKINADRIELAGSTTFSNYAQLEDVIKEQRVEYATSTSNTEAPTGGWDTDYPTREQGEYIWRRVIIIKGNDAQISGTPELITPSDGKDGTSVKIKGTASEQPIDIGDGLYTIKFNGITVTDGELGDGYMYGEPADLYVCVKVTSAADHFSNVGQIQGPQGVSGAGLQIRYKVKQDGQTITTPTNPDSEGWSTNMPTSGVIYMTQKLSNATAWSTPIQITGKDGEPGKDGSDIQYAYYRNNSTTCGSKPTGTVTTTPPRSYVWTTSPNGVTSSYQYEYVSVRTKPAGADEFGTWSTPRLWSKWGEKGQDGDGVEYLYCLQTDNTNPPTITISYGATPTLPWTDEPTGTSEAYPYEYVVQVKSTDAKNTTYTGKLWGVYDGMLALYAKSTGVPSTPTGEGSPASSSENTTWQKDMPTSLTDTQVIYASYKTFLGTSWSNPVKIYATDGKDGTSVSIKGTADSVALVAGETNKFTLTYNNVIVKQGTLGDGYLYNGDLYVCVKVATVSDVADYFENVGMIKGDTGAHTIGVETYYYVTRNTYPFRDSNGDPLESPNSGYGIETPPNDTSKWANDIKSISWGDKYAFDKTTQVTTSEKAAYIYQYLWIREKYTYSDHTEERPHIEWTDPRLDASNTTIGNWCYDNDKTLINGGNIATGTVTAKQINTTGLHADFIEVKDEDDNTIFKADAQSNTVYASNLSTISANLGTVTTGSIESPDYEDGTGFKISANQDENMIDSKYFKVTQEGTIIASDITLTGNTNSTDKYLIDSDNFKVSQDGHIEGIAMQSVSGGEVKSTISLDPDMGLFLNVKKEDGSFAQFATMNTFTGDGNGTGFLTDWTVRDANGVIMGISMLENKAINIKCENLLVNGANILKRLDELTATDTTISKRLDNLGFKKGYLWADINNDGKTSFINIGWIAQLGKVVYGHIEGSVFKDYPAIYKDKLDIVMTDTKTQPNYDNPLNTISFPGPTKELIESLYIQADSGILFLAFNKDSVSGNLSITVHHQMDITSLSGSKDYYPDLDFGYPTSDEFSG